MNTRSITPPVLDGDEADALEAIGVAPVSGQSTCPDSSLLLAADDGVLDDALAEDVRTHVKSCPSCRMLAEDLAVVFAEGDVGIAGDRIAARVTRSPSAPRKLAWGLAGGSLLIAASIAGLVINLERGPLPSVVFPVQAVPSSSNAPTVFFVDTPAPGLADVELTLRGESASGADLSGESLGRPSEDEDDWRRAVALVESGDLPSARRALTDLCERPTWRGALACAGLIELNRGRDH